MWSGIYYIKYRWRREEEETRQMYDLVESIVGKEIVIPFICMSIATIANNRGAKSLFYLLIFVSLYSLLTIKA